jgi:hypothetical protein
VGTAAAWDGEIVRVDAINAAASTIVLGRGCADTVPVPHAAGSRLFFYDEWGASDGREYSAGEVVSAKLVSRSGASALTLSDTPAISLTMNKRAARPYPPAGIKINGNGNPVATTGPLAITWRHRDRLLQLDQLIDSEAASIGPEASTRYALRFFNVLGELIVEKLDIAGTTATVVLDHSGGTTMQLYAISDHGESWQKHERTFTYTPPAGPVVTTITADSYSPTQTVIDGGEVAP